jgi:hypothetical protein
LVACLARLYQSCGQEIISYRHFPIIISSFELMD